MNTPILHKGINNQLKQSDFARQSISTEDCVKSEVYGICVLQEPDNWLIETYFPERAKSISEDYSSYFIEVIQAQINSKPKPNKNNKMLSINGEVMVYPNPAVGTIRLESNDNIINIEIFNLDGRLQFKKNYTGEVKVLSISTDGYAPGVYYITIVSANTRYTQKIVVS